MHPPMYLQIRSGALEQVIEDLFKDPPASEMPFTVSIPVYDIDWEPWSHKSGWPHLNAEHVLGALKATHRDRTDVAKLNQWRKAWRNLQGTFVFLPVEDWSKENLSLREDAVGKAMQSQWTAYQKLQFVIAECKKLSKKLKKQLTIAEYTKALKDVRIHQKNEPMNDDMVSTALTVSKALFQSSICTEVFSFLDDQYGHMAAYAPFGTHLKFLQLMRKTGGTVELVEWVLLSVRHGVTTQSWPVEDFSVSKMKNVGIPLSLLRHEFLQRLLRHELASFKYPSDTEKKNILLWCGSHNSVHQYLRGMELSHLKLVEASAQQYCLFVASVCFPLAVPDHNTKTGALKSAVKARKGAAEALEYAGLTEDFQELRQLRQKETKEAHIMSPERATPSKASERSDLMSGDEDSDSEQKRLTELKMDINSSTQLRLQKLGEDAAGAVQSAVERVFKENVKVFVVGESLDVTELKRQTTLSSLALKHGHVSNINLPESAQGRDLSNTLIVDVLRYQGCAKTQAQWRVPPFKEAYHTKVVNAVLEARDPSYAQESGVPAMIHSTDVVCVCST